MVGNQHFGWRPLYWTIWSESEIQPIQQFKGQHKFFGPTVGQEFFDWPTVHKLTKGGQASHQIFAKMISRIEYGRCENPKVGQKWAIKCTVHKWPSIFLSLKIVLNTPGNHKIKNFNDLTIEIIIFVYFFSLEQVFLSYMEHMLN